MLMIRLYPSPSRHPTSASPPPHLPCSPTDLPCSPPELPFPRPDLPFLPPDIPFLPPLASPRGLLSPLRAASSPLPLPSLPPPIAIASPSRRPRFPSPSPSLSPPVALASPSHRPCFPLPSPSLPPPLAPPIALASPSHRPRFPLPSPSLPPPIALASPSHHPCFPLPSPSLPPLLAPPIALASPSHRPRFPLTSPSLPPPIALASPSHRPRFPLPSPSLPPPIALASPSHRPRFPLPSPSLSPPVALASPSHRPRFPLPSPSLPPPIALASPSHRSRFPLPSPSLPPPIALASPSHRPRFPLPSPSLSPPVALASPSRCPRFHLPSPRPSPSLPPPIALASPSHRPRFPLPSPSLPPPITLASPSRRPRFHLPSPRPSPSLPPPIALASPSHRPRFPLTSPSLPPPIALASPSHRPRFPLPSPSLPPPIALASPSHRPRFPLPSPSLSPPVALASPSHRPRFPLPSPSLPPPIALASPSHRSRFPSHRPRFPLPSPSLPPPIALASPSHRPRFPLPSPSLPPPSLVHLRHLSVWGSSITRASASLLLAFIRLLSANLAWTALSHLPARPSLTALHLSQCPLLSIGFPLPSSSSSPFASSPSSSHSSSSSSSFPLTHLVISGASIAPPSSLFPPHLLASLTHLNLSTAAVPDALLLHLVHSLPHTLLAAMEAQQGDDDSPPAGPDEPPLPQKPTEPTGARRSGLYFLRGSSVPLTPDLPRSTINDSAARETSTPTESPRPDAFTLPPAVASCSHDPTPAAPSPTPSTVLVSVGPPPSASSCQKRARSGKWAQRTLLIGGRRIPAPDNPPDPPPEVADNPESTDIPIRADTGSPALTKMQLREQMYLEASINYETKWSGMFSWLVFGKTKDGFPFVKCSVCMSYGKENTKYARQGDDGGRDMQTQAFRGHEHTDAHTAAVERQMKIAKGIRSGQQVISDFINSDVEGRRAIRLMRSVEFLCQCDAPISMFPKLMRHLAEQDTPDIPRQSYGVYLTREALAVKDAATSNPDLDMVDKVVRKVAANLGESCIWSQRFKYLQRVIYNTNLEVQGIHTVRWLSRGDAVRRLCKVLGACTVLLWENSHKAYEIVTCYKFQFCLFFLADILADMNDLNRCFQKRDLDVTEISKTIESTTADLTERYLETNKPFGGETKSWLVGFLQLHGRGGGKKVKVRCVDGEGRPINHMYTMHERKLKGHKYGSSYAECVKLCRSFARDCVDNLNERLDDLGKLGPTKLFRAGKWPKIKAQREKKCREWLLGCSKLFRNKLPGFDIKAAERELPTFCAIMETHHEMEGFTQGLTNILGSADSKRRRPAKSTKMAVAERHRKGKAKEGQDEAAGSAGQNEEEEEGEDEEEEDVEQDLGDDQELVGEEEEEFDDNPFLSDDDDVEEVFHIDKPVH
ncbi:unnamed protein product [Closterium sp. Naga37s-1]|nr:unnamed protein product [Closterium sp. Naga37s-1]